jgi:hypothetical protein
MAQQSQLKCHLPGCSNSVKADKRQCKGFLFLIGAMRAVSLVSEHWRDEVKKHQAQGVSVVPHMGAQRLQQPLKVESSKMKELKCLLAPDITPRVCLGAGAELRIDLSLCAGTQLVCHRCCATVRVVSCAIAQHSSGYHEAHRAL